VAIAIFRQNINGTVSDLARRVLQGESELGGGYGH
jgi:hypothetical protein